MNFQILIHTNVSYMCVCKLEGFPACCKVDVIVVCLAKTAQIFLLISKFWHPFRCLRDTSEKYIEESD